MRCCIVGVLCDKSEHPTRTEISLGHGYPMNFQSLAFLRFRFFSTMGFSHVAPFPGHSFLDGSILRWRKNLSASSSFRSCFLNSILEFSEGLPIRE